MTLQEHYRNFVSANRPYSLSAKTSRFSAIQIITVGLIFFSIVIYGAGQVWWEGVILISIFILGAISEYSRTPRLETELKRLLAPFLLLAIYSFLQGICTLFVHSGQLPAWTVLPYSFDLTASFWCAIKFFALAVFIKLLLDSFQANIKLLIWSLIVTGNFFALLGIFRFLAQGRFPEYFEQFIMPQLRPNVGFGTFVNQNHFAFLMLMTLGLNIGLAAFAGLEKHWRFILSIGSLICWTAIIVTASRGGIVSSLVTIGTLILLSRHGEGKNSISCARETYWSKSILPIKRLAFFFVIAGLLVVGVVLIGQDRVVSRFEAIPEQFEGATDAGTFRRIDAWRAAVSMFEAQPVYGVGFGGFRFAVSQHIDISGELQPEQAHNDYLELAASGGAFALICTILFLYEFFSTLKKRFTTPATQFENAARIGVICAIAGVITHNFFDFGLQFLSNQLFLAAIVTVAVGQNNSDAGENNFVKFSTEKIYFWSIGYSIFLFFLIIYCFAFGYSRLQTSVAAADSNKRALLHGILRIPFDPDFYETKAFIEDKSGDAQTASEDLMRAIELRPENYYSHLELAKIRRRQNQLEAAETEYRQAIKLAPFYAEPHFYLGEFLVANNRIEDGFKEMHVAFERNPQYFEQVFPLAWREAGENAANAVKLLSPLNALEKIKLSDILFEKKAYAAAVWLVCRDEDLNGEKRDNLIVRLLGKRQFLLADQIDRRVCDSTNHATVKLTNGDFESRYLADEIGFGWRLGVLPDTVKVGFDDEDSASGSNNLGFIFNGKSDPSQPLVSQMIVVEKNHKYHFSFDYKTEKIVSGGLPVLQLILKQSSEDFKFKEFNLAANTGIWSRVSAEIQTDSQTEAIEIRLTRQPCSYSLCPVYGRLWLDNFVLQ
jgi:tetratricopeptide (TPR) repeat protein